MGAFERIIKRLHRVFNRNPYSTSVLKIQTTSEWSLRIAELKMTVTLSGGEQITIDISTGTLQGLANELISYGFEATVLSPGAEGDAATNLEGEVFTALDGSPLTLLPTQVLLSRGIQNTASVISTGDAATNLEGEVFTALDGSPLTVLSDQVVFLQYPTSALWAELRTVGWELDDQAARLKSAEAQLYMGSAEGHWLDYWAKKHFGIERSAGESDEAYAQRVAYEVVRPNQNNRALEIILRDSLGIDATILNAWPNRDDLPAEDQAKAPGHFLLDMSIANEMDPQEAQELIDLAKAVVRRHRAGGTDFLSTVLRKLVQTTENQVMAETIAMLLTATFEESFQPGPIYCGAAWYCGTPGLFSGNNDAIKEQVAVRVLDATDDSITDQYLYGGS